ncbi:MAG TPA: TlpA disulfide reductase family protein [Schlesneria sp.]|jgi:thiol-disulfide isomerase/thioredoxin
MFANSRIAFGLLLVAYISTSVGFAADDEEEVKHPFSIKLVAEDGKPVDGAKAGVTAYFGSEAKTIPTDDGTGWRYWQGATSDANGVVNLVDGGDADYLCVVARHPVRQLVGIWKIDPKKLDSAKATELVTITMQLECRVSGKITCRDLTELNRPIGWTNAYLTSDAGRAFGCSSTDQTFHFFVPPGEYELFLYGSDLHKCERKVSVTPGQREVDLGATELPATRLALLSGMPAPELPEIECWKNGPGVNLADLKGKCVILDFWGYWCGPCVGRMPELFKLHAKYHDQGLEIIGIHVDLGEQEKEPVDTVEKLDRRLIGIRKDVWDGQDVPYPVAIVAGKLTSYGTAIETRKAASPVAALYGVTAYPTLILIDRQGNVVGHFAPNRAEHIEQLERLLKNQRP